MSGKSGGGQWTADRTRRWMLKSSLGALAALTVRPLLAQTLSALNPKLAGDLYPIHDPCIIKDGDTFYVFCTTPHRDTPKQIPWYRSKDLINWKRGGHVFDALPAWAKAAVIGLAGNPTLNPDDPRYHWEDMGLVLESRTSDNYNALDPNHIIDRDGKHWLAFGSFWSGLKIMELDSGSGKPKSDAKIIAIAERPKPPDAIEAVFIINRAGYYYLFCSFDFCCRGADSSYYTVVGRSKDIVGPYLDKSGKPMLEGGGTLVLAAGGGEPRWRGLGHCAVLRDEDKDYIVYHAYDADHEGRPTLRIAPMGWSEDNWPVAFV
jgi:arabinan endo-1,5-alpha-L-arabinosidase